MIIGYYLLSDIPILIALFPIYCFLADLLIPNTKVHKICGWVTMEMIEHLVIPIIFFVAIYVVGGLPFIPLMIIILVYLYGRVLGNATTWNDWKKVLALTSLFFMLIFLVPYVVWILNFGYHIEGWIPLSMIFVVSTLLYIQFKFKLIKVGNIIQNNVYTYTVEKYLS